MKCKKANTSLRRCRECGAWKRDVKKRRQNTAYVQEELNFVVCCSKCFDHIEKYWDEKWEELWQDQMAGLSMQ